MQQVPARLAPVPMVPADRTVNIVAVLEPLVVVILVAVPVMLALLVRTLGVGVRAQLARVENIAA